MFAKCKYLLLFILVTLFTCKEKGELWKVPVGYQDFEISLGDNYKEVNEKIGELKLDVNASNVEDLKNYFSTPSQIEINNLLLNPIVFLRFNKNELVKFEIIYTIDEVSTEVDFQSLIEELANKELTKIDELVKMKDKIIIDNDELWLRKIDTVSGRFPKIKYRVQAIP